MANKYKIIPISKLIVNPENYRFDPVSNENEAIKAMLDAHNPKIKQLLIDILKHGLNPSDIPLVYEASGKFITLEGNRRLTALKIINNVEVLKSIDMNYYNEYSKLLEKNPQNPNINLTNIPCINYDNPEESNRWVALKHTGINGGKGTLPWGTEEKRIFQDRTSKEKSSISATTLLNLINYIRNSPYYAVSIKESVDKIKITNLERLIFDPSVRAVLGIDIVKGTIYKLYPDEEIAKPITKVISDLANKNFKVGQIYTKDLRLTYTSNFDDKILPDINKKLVNPLEISTVITGDTPIPIVPDGPEQISLLNNNTHISSNEEITSSLISVTSDEVKTENNTSVKQSNLGNVSNNIISNSPSTSNLDKDTTPKPKENEGTTKKIVRDMPDINNRKTLIPGRTQIRINNPRINQIYKELKKMEISQYTNAVAVLLRVFIEVSMDEYIEKNSVISVTADSKLNKKVQACLEDLKAKKLISSDHVKPMNVSISDKDSILSVNTFNSYVHNKHMYPDATQLKNCWNQIEGFMMAILRNC